MGGDRRHRMSEADEDEELLDDDLGDKVITMFSENPWCEYSQVPVIAFIQFMERKNVHVYFCRVLFFTSGMEAIRAIPSPPR